MIGKELLGLLYSGNGERSKAGCTPVSSSNKIITEKRREFPIERKKNFDNQLKNLGLEEDRLKDESVLDVGCGQGDFVFGLRKEGVTDKVYGVDVRSVIEDTKKQLPEYSENFFAVNSSGKGIDLPKNVKDKKFSVVAVHSVFDHLIQENSRAQLKSNIRHLREVMKDDGKAIIYPVNEKSWSKLVNEFNLEDPTERVIVKFKESRVKRDNLDVDNKHLVLFKGDRVNKGRFQC